MAPGVAITRVYLDDHRHGVVTCLYCRVKWPIMTAHDHPHLQHLRGKAFQVKCGACHRVFALRFDVRRYARITVALPGKLFQLNTRQTLDTLTVTSLSVDGMGFLTTQPLLGQPGERYDIVFCLNDKDRSLVFEEIVIARIDGQMVGATFFHHASYKPEPDFAMMAALSEPWRKVVDL
jgi:uncharacterized Zn-finger protein